MNSLERVKAAIQFKNPDRIPTFNLISGDIYPLLIGHSVNWKPGWNEGEEGLFPHISFNFNWDRPEWARSNPDYEGDKWKAIPHEEIDEWGCIWNMRGNDDNMGHPGRPSLPDWNDYPNYISKYTPNADDDSRYSIAKNMKEKLEEEKYLMLIIPTFGPSQVVSEMRGFHNYLIDHQKHPKELVRALELVAEYHIDLIKNSIKRGLNPHGIWLVDDLGEQTGPFFSPRTFRKYYESSYKWIIDDAHDMGIDVHLHCCGKIEGV